MKTLRAIPVPPCAYPDMPGRRGGAPGGVPPDARPCGPDGPRRRPAVTLLSIARACPAGAPAALRIPKPWLRKPDTLPRQGNPTLRRP